MILHPLLKLSSLTPGQKEILGTSDRNEVLYKAKDILGGYAPNYKDEYKPFDLRKPEDQTYFWDLCGLLNYKDQKWTEKKISSIIVQYQQAIQLEVNANYKNLESTNPVYILDEKIKQQCSYIEMVDPNEYAIVKKWFRSYAGMLKGYDGVIDNQDLLERTRMRLKQLAFEQTLDSSSYTDFVDLKETYADSIWKALTQ